jgi:hypothetical protein
MRSFTVVSVHKAGRKVSYTGVRFISEAPHLAAKKVFSQACTTKGKSACTMLIVIRETTQGSKKKEYTYKVSRKYSPVEVELPNGDIVEYKYTLKVKSA